MNNPDITNDIMNELAARRKFPSNTKAKVLEFLWFVFIMAVILGGTTLGK